MIYERPPSFDQLNRLEQDKQPKLLQQSNQTDQDLINALLLQKIAELEAKLANQTSYGDSADI